MMLNHITFLPNPFAKFQFEKLDFLEIKAFETLVEPFVVAYKFRCNKNRSTHPSISSFRPCNHPLWWSSFSQRSARSSLESRSKKSKWKMLFFPWILWSCCSNYENPWSVVHLQIESKTTQRSFDRFFLGSCTVIFLWFGSCIKP